MSRAVSVMYVLNEQYKLCTLAPHSYMNIVQLQPKVLMVVEEFKKDNFVYYYVLLEICKIQSESMWYRLDI